MVNPFASRRAENKWVLPISVMALMTGFMISLAWIRNDNRTTRLTYLTPMQRARFSEGNLDLAKDNERLRFEMSKIREENTKLQNAVAQNSNASQSLNKSLQDLKIFAALTELEGPGVAISLRDSRPSDQAASMIQIIHDTDVLRVVNELWNAGAEGITVNDLRVGPTTNFRCVGTTILVDATKIATPVVVRAVGDAKTLFGGMNLPGGVLDEIRMTDPKMVEIEIVDKMRLSAYTGTTNFKVAKVPEAKK